MIFVSYFTPNYKKIIEEYLLPSLIGLELPYYTEEVKDLGNWRKNANYKLIFIKQCLKKFNTDIVWIDADAIINKFPTLFWIIPKEYDLAVHYLDWMLHYGRPSDKGKYELLTGTMFFRNNDNGKRLLDKWIELTLPSNPQQKTLEKSIKQMPEIKVYKLPRSYCFIVATSKGEPLNPLKDPIISHFQKSREMRKRK